MPDGRSKVKRIAWLLAGAIVAALLCVLGALTWGRTEVAVRKAMRDPASLSEAEEGRVMRYIEGHFWNRFPGTDISTGRQGRLVHAALTRASQGQDGILWWVVRQWRWSRMFAGLPDQTNALIKRGGGNAAYIVNILIGAWPERIEPLLDIDYIMLSSRDGRLITAVSSVSMDILLSHRDACLQMLGRNDIESRFQRVFLGMVVGNRLSRAWFANEQDLLDRLKSLGDERVSERVGLIEQDLSAPVGSGGQEESGARRLGTRPGELMPDTRHR